MSKKTTKKKTKQATDIQRVSSKERVLDILAARQAHYEAEAVRFAIEGEYENAYLNYMAKNITYTLQVILRGEL